MAGTIANPLIRGQLLHRRGGEVGRCKPERIGAVMLVDAVVKVEVPVGGGPLGKARDHLGDLGGDGHQSDRAIPGVRLLHLPADGAEER